MYIHYLFVCTVHVASPIALLYYLIVMVEFPLS